jgi:heme exporter protein D
VEIEEEEVEKKPGKSLLVGIIIVIVGAGLALGSWLHDAWEIPIGGTAYGSFGWLNISVAVIGIIVLIVGIIFVALSRKKTVIAEEI